MRASLLLLAAAAFLDAAPRLFYSDLDSGPNTGGLNGNGAIVTLHGEGFGPNRGSSTVTVGAAPVAAYHAWTDDTISVSLGPRTKSGEIHVSVNGQTSNPIPFSVRPGNIYFAGSTASAGGKPGSPADSNTGAFHTPWASLRRCRDAIQPGDICYAMDGLTLDTLEGGPYQTSLILRDSGQPGRPKAIVAFPGARVRVGTPSARKAIFGVSASHWTIAGLEVVGGRDAGLFATNGEHWRIVDLLLSCPSGYGPSGCLSTTGVDHVTVLGTTVFDAGCSFNTVPCDPVKGVVDVEWNGAALSSRSYVSSLNTGAKVTVNGQTRTIRTVQTNTGRGMKAVLDAPLEPASGSAGPGTWFHIPPDPGKLYQTVYFSGGNHIELGWSHVSGGTACRGVQLHSSPPSPVAVVSVSSSTPARLQMARPQNWPDGHRIAFAGHPLESYVKPVSKTEYELFHDPSLTRPMSPDAVPAAPRVVAGGFSQYDISIHDNVIHHIRCDGVNLATVDPSRGKVEVFGNIIYNAGMGPDPMNGAAKYSCISVPHITNAGKPSAGEIDIRSNMLFNCGLRGGPEAAAIYTEAGAKQLRLGLRNNTIVQSGNTPVLAGPGALTQVTSSTDARTSRATAPRDHVDTILRSLKHPEAPKVAPSQR